MHGERSAWRVLGALLFIACTPLHDLDAASRGGASGGASSQNTSTCRDGEVDGSESDVDCGGSCKQCALGYACRKDADCAVGSCVERHCQAAHCVDQKMSVGETDVDCGGEECSPCGVHQLCHVSADCSSNACTGNVCVATGCDNELVDGSETDLNCGGGTCPACRIGRHCSLGGDCESGVCLDGTCSDGCSVLGCASGGGSGNGGSAGQAGGAANGSGGSTSGGVTSAGGAWNGGGYGGNAHGGTVSIAMGGAGGGGSQASGGVTQGGAAAASGGAGGASGSAGAAQGGVAGGAGSAASGGTLASAGGSAGGSGVNDPTCAGCARLSVPLASASDKANFVIPLPAQRSFAAGVVTYRVYVKAGTGGQLRAYVQHGGSPDYLQLFQEPPVALTAVSGWQDIVWNVGAQTANYDKSIVGRIGVQISGAGATSWTNPTIAYLDSVSVSGVDTGPWTFDTSSSVYASPAISAPVNVMFCNYGDSPVSGSAVSWYSH